MDPTVLLPWLPAGFIHCWEHTWLFPSPVPPTVMGIHFEDQDCISLPSPSLSRHSTAWQGQGAARQSGVRLGCHMLPDSEVPHFGDAVCGR